MSCKSILVVEDDLDIRRDIAEVLEGEGYHVLQAENGQIALDILSSLNEESLPGCMILDIMMPVMCGNVLVEVIEAKYPHFKSIKILVATATGGPVNQISFPHAVERIQKPFDIDELLMKIEEHCGKPFQGSPVEEPQHL